MAKPATPRNGNGNGPGIVGVVARFSGKVVDALSPQFLTLILLNALFFGMMFWYIGARAEHSMTIIQQLLTNCLKDKPL
jgi:hypothetical protein